MYSRLRKLPSDRKDSHCFQHSSTRRNEAASPHSLPVVSFRDSKCSKTASAELALKTSGVCEGCLSCSPHYPGLCLYTHWAAQEVRVSHAPDLSSPLLIFTYPVCQSSIFEFCFSTSNLIDESVWVGADVNAFLFLICFNGGGLEKNVLWFKE